MVEQLIILEPQTARKSLKPNPVSNSESVYFHRIAGTLARRGTRYKLIDLFGGAGGLTLGFTNKLGHTFQPVWANDFNEESVETYVKNFDGHIVLGDINEVLADPTVRLPEADVVIGGPPCQGFSLLNKKRKDDPRKQLWRPFLEVVERSKAQVFVMENVAQLLGSEEHKEILVTARRMGFHVRSTKLCAADFGVPQTRWRAFIIGCRYSDPAVVFPPKKTHRSPNADLSNGNPNLYVPNPKPWRTVRDAIRDLPPPTGVEIRAVEPPLNLHFGRTPTAKSLKRYKAIPREGMNRFDLQRNALHLTPKCWIRKKSGGTDLFGRLWWDKPAFTIRTEFFKPEKGRYLHPDQHRPITLREAARLQSFPDDFKFAGSKIEIAKQIGNAVPPMLAARIADCVYALLETGKEGNVR